jgi:hypothetical protein
MKMDGGVVVPALVVVVQLRRPVTVAPAAVPIVSPAAGHRDLAAVTVPRTYLSSSEPVMRAAGVLDPNRGRPGRCERIGGGSGGSLVALVVVTVLVLGSAGSCGGRPGLQLNSS